MIFLPFLLFSCEKTLPDVPDNEIPVWLKTRISLDEQTIQDYPKYHSLSEGDVLWTNICID
jgi:hypothetical protein